MLTHGDESGRAVAERREVIGGIPTALELRCITLSGLSDGNDPSVDGRNVAVTNGARQRTHERGTR